MKKWNIISKFKNHNSEFKIGALIDLLLKNRGITTKKAVEEFLHPRLEDITPKSVGFDSKELKKAVARINKAIKEKEQIVIFGDYDVDGITATAILWETFHNMGASVLPYIPNRIDEGYGLSKVGIQNVESKIPHTRLIITVDNGIVANDAVDFANANNIDVIITDHHTPPAGGRDKLPKAHAIVHTTKLCGAGVAWLLAQQFKIQNSKFKIDEENHLELAALGTVADLVPLTGANRTIVMHGIGKLSKTKRVGLLELFKQAGITQPILTTYEIGYLISPRLNAAGRIESAMDSLRLLCTKDLNRARLLSEKLELINRERQLILKEAASHAITSVRDSFSAKASLDESRGKQKSEIKKILIVSHESYQEGVIGLVAGKLVEEFYRPAIVISLGEKHSKASARSVNGFNIIEFLRMHTDHFMNVGGHPMAAGFTIETEKIVLMQETLEKLAHTMLDDAILTRSLKIDCELPVSLINQTLYTELQKLSPFGMGNPEPVFVSRKTIIEEKRILGKDGKHLKLTVSQPESGRFEAIAFGMGGRANEIKVGEAIDLVYVIDENSWNGQTKLQMKVKDFSVPAE